MLKLILSKMCAFMLFSSSLVIASEQTTVTTYPYVVGVFHVDGPELENKYLKAFEVDIQKTFGDEPHRVPKPYQISSTDTFIQAHDKWLAVCELFRKSSTK